jgi:hypothetical protein
MLIYNLVTAALLILVFRAAVQLESPRHFPWAAVALTALVIGGLILQTTWSGAMSALDSDPSRTGWWRPVTSVFLQNGGWLGYLWNIVTIAVITALAEWHWGRLTAAALFLAGALLPYWLGMLAGDSHGSTDPRNWVGSSGATYFLGATLAGALLIRALPIRALPIRALPIRALPIRALPTGAGLQKALLASSGPAVGLAAWFAQHNAHGLVVVEGFALGTLLALIVELGRSRTGGDAPVPSPEGTSVEKPADSAAV